MKSILILLLLSVTAYAQFNDAGSIYIENDSTNINSNAKIVNNNNKSVADIFISLVVPGWSFFKKKEYVKGAAFVAVDVAGITSYAWFSHRADEELQRSKDYANAHYNPQKYIEFSDTLLYSSSLTVNPNIIKFSDTSGHNFEFDEFGKVIKDLDYYEMIGKYEKFVQGWDDVDMAYTEIISTYGNIYIPKTKGDSVQVYDSSNPDSPKNKYTLTDARTFHFVLLSEMIQFDKEMMVPTESFYYGYSAHAQYYMSIRDESNNLNSYADMMLWVVAVNHLSSFGFSIYHYVSDNSEVEEDGTVSYLPIIYPTVNFETQARGVSFSWQF